MRFTNVILALAVSAIGAPVVLVGCGSDETSGATASPTSSSTGGAVVGEFPCSPTAPVCTKVKSDCIALEENAGDEFGLRMSQLTITKPDALAAGIVAGVVRGGLTMNLGECDLNGDGTFSWLLQFNKTTNKLRSGGAKPVEDPSAGYCFVAESLGAFDVKPIEVDAPIGADGSFSVTAPDTLFVPIFLDAAASDSLVLPLHDAKLSGTLSEGNKCIGSYNDENLLTSKSCQASGDVKKFNDAGTLDGYITLEEADTVEIKSALNQTLCVLLSGNPTMYGDGSTPINKCKRDMDGKILFKGDFCSTDAGDCGDASKLGATFAAGAVKINGTCN